MTEHADRDPTPARPWGFWVGDCFIPLPKGPMLDAGLGPAPFQLALPMGQERYITDAPEGFDPETWAHPGQEAWPYPARGAACR